MKKKNIEPGRKVMVVPESRYRPNYHPGRVYELWELGLCHPAKICKEFRITKDTLARWLEKHYQFRIQYNMGLEVGKTKWIQRGIDNLNEKFFNHNVFRDLIGHAFNELKEKKRVKIAGMKGAKTLEQYQEAICEIFASGEYTPDEIAYLTKAINDSAAAVGMYEDVKNTAVRLEKALGIHQGSKNITMEGDVYDVLENKDEKNTEGGKDVP